MGEYSKILLAVDFSQGTDRLCLKAASLAKQFSAQLGMVHVVEPIIVDSGYDFLPVSEIDIEDGIVKNAKKQLHALADKHGIPADSINLLRGATKKEILQLARDEAYDLIIVGSHGKHGVALLLGSTANAVLHGAPCDVLAVRIHD